MGFVDRHFRKLVAVMMAAFIGGVVLSGMLVINTFYRDPVTAFVWRALDGQPLCDAEVIASPSISQARIVDFATDAAVTMNSYDYSNQALVISSALRQYFTRTGQDSYQAAVNESGSPLAIRRNYVSASAFRDGLPNVADEGFLVGRKFWIVEVPLVQFLTSNTAERRVTSLLTMTIVRVRPSAANPNGIAIDGVTAVNVASRE